MYTVNKTRSRRRLFIEFVIVLTILFGVAGILVWFFMFRNTGESSANFSRSGGTVAVVAPSTKDFTTDEFVVTLPEGWELNGKQKPFYNQTYYEFQSKIKDYTNRWLRIYVDVIPTDFALNKLLPVEAKENQLVPGNISPNCNTFEGAPKSSLGQARDGVWKATWDNVSFICSITSQLNYIGTASAKDGYAVPVTGEKGTHRYFFVYIDHNVRPDDNILKSSVKSFKAL